MKEQLILLSFLLTCISIQAQKIEFKISDINTSKPIENASVFDRLENLLAITSVNGSFKIEEKDLPLNVSVKALNYQDIQLELSKAKTIIYLSPKSEALSEVLVRSSLIATRIKELPASISIISENDLERIDASNMVQVFNTVPGVYVNQGALNTTKLNIRGIGSRSQYSTNKIQAYFEGIPLTTGEGELTLDDFDPETISSIEIIKGPTSSIYGAGLGGAINMFAKGIGNEQTNISAKSIFGSYGLLQEYYFCKY